MNLYLVRPIDVRSASPSHGSPVVKSIETLKEDDLPLGDRVNVCYSSTVVTQGRGSGIVFATGMSSQIGRIATAMSNKDSDDYTHESLWFRIKEKLIIASGVRGGTPLQQKLTKLAYVLFACAVLLALVVFAVAKFKITEEVAIYVRPPLPFAGLLYP